MLGLGFQGVFVEKGPFFHGKRPSRAPQIPHGPRPPPDVGFTENPSRGSPKKGRGGGRAGGGGGWCLCGIWGAREGPLR